MTTRTSPFLLWLYCLLISFAQFSFRADIIDDPRAQLPGTGWLAFFEMSLSDRYQAVNPFLYRVLSPEIAKMLMAIGMNPTLSWAFLTVVASSCTLFLSACILSLNLPKDRACLFIALFMLSSTYWVFGFYHRYFFLTDPLQFFLITLAYWGYLHSSQKLLIASISFACLNKESALVLLIFPVLSLFFEIRTSAIKQKLSHSLPQLSITILIPLAVYAALRYGVNHKWSLDGYTLGAAGNYGILENIRRNFHRLQDSYFTWSTFDFLWIIGLFEIIDTGRQSDWRDRSSFAFFPVLLIAFVCKFLTDPPRAFSILFPFFAYALGVGLSHLEKIDRLEVILVLTVCWCATNLSAPTFDLSSGWLASHTTEKIFISLFAIAYYFFKRRGYATNGALKYPH